PELREKKWERKWGGRRLGGAVSRSEKEKVFKPPYYLEPTAIIVDVTETPVKRLKNTSEDYLWLEVSQISAKFSLFCAQNNLKLEKADSKNKSPFVALSMESISELTGEQKRAFVKILNIPGIIFSSSTLAKARLESKLQYIGPALIEAAADGNFTDVVDIINRIEPLYDYKEILKEALKTQRLGTGNTPLQEAIKGQHTSLVKYFSSLSASLKVINHKNHQGLTALNFATAIGSSPAIVQALEWCSQ
ncbi:ankyrin repeat domain-containing protein, partial [Coxiella burnetii]